MYSFKFFELTLLARIDEPCLCNFSRLIYFEFYLPVGTISVEEFRIRFRFQFYVWRSVAMPVKFSIFFDEDECHECGVFTNITVDYRRIYFYFFMFIWHE